MSFSPLAAILSQHKLTGPNYMDWKRNLNIVLTAEEHNFVLTDPCPPKPNENAPQTEQNAYKKWVKSNDMAKCYILASISSDLSKQHELMPTAADMMLSLSEMFVEKDRTQRLAVISEIMNTRQAEGTPVQDHMLKMIALFRQMEELGGTYNAEEQIDMVLATLAPSFKPFKLNYTMSKKDCTLTELMNELKAAESILKPALSVNFTHRASFSTNPNFKGKGIKKEKKGKPNKAAKLGVAQNQMKEKKPKGKCFRCGKKGALEEELLSIFGKVYIRQGQGNSWNLRQYSRH